MSDGERIIGEGVSIEYDNTTDPTPTGAAPRDEARSHMLRERILDVLAELLDSQKLDAYEAADRIVLLVAAAPRADPQGRDAAELFAAFREWVAADEAKRGATHLEIWSDGCGHVGVALPERDILFDNIEDGIGQLRAARAPGRAE